MVKFEFSQRPFPFYNERFATTLTHAKLEVLRKMKVPSESTINVFPLDNYSFGAKEANLEKDTSVADRLARMKAK